MSMELKSYLSKKFEGRESFLENIVFPIFGEEKFEDMYDVEALDNEDLQAMAKRTGIKSAIQYGLVQVGTTEINIYDVTVSDRVMMRRNRVGIQQLIRRIMLDYTSAFIIFHYEDSDSWDWRFSFCQKDNKEVTDLRRRQLILDYVEQFRTSYNTKDIQFLEQVFSDDALIITGKVISQKKDNMKLPDKIIYKKQTKQEYLTNLRRVFANNSYIKVTFDDIKVKRHSTNPNFYGVTLHQGYTSSNYHDDGYLFLLWDFTDEDHPQIHVRTWQPDQINGGRIPDDEIFSLNDFDI